MGSTNNGKQILTFDYAQEGTSQGFNKIMHKLIPSGIISGGNLMKVTDGTVAISTFLSFFEDTNNGLGLRLETTDTANVLVTETNNWIVGRFNWLNIEENYMDFLGVAWDNIQSTDIIFGKCIFNALGELTSFDTSRKSWSRSYYENFKSKYPNFCVLPNVPENDKVLVCKGKGYINGKKVELTSESTQSISFDLNVSNSRIDLVVINENSEIEVIKGKDSGDAKVPKCPLNKLILAKVNLPSNPTSISGTFIENIYSVNPYTNSELVDYSITKEKFKQTTINYLTPVGIILPYGGKIAPDGYLLCDGRAVSRTEYSALFNVIGTYFGNGDGINTFNVPDLRECVPVGIGTRSSGVATHDLYSLGEFKDDQFKSHNHGAKITGGEHSHWVGARNDALLNVSGDGDCIVNQGDSHQSGSVQSSSEGHSHGITIHNTGGNTTHGKQVGVNFVIKY